MIGYCDKPAYWWQKEHLFIDWHILRYKENSHSVALSLISNFQGISLQIHFLFDAYENMHERGARSVLCVYMCVWLHWGSCAEIIFFSVWYHLAFVPMLPSTITLLSTHIHMFLHAEKGKDKDVEKSRQKGRKVEGGSDSLRRSRTEENILL